MSLVLLSQYLICESELVPDSDQLGNQREFGAVCVNLNFAQLSGLRTTHVTHGFETRVNRAASLAVAVQAPQSAVLLLQRRPRGGRASTAADECCG